MSNGFTMQETFNEFLPYYFGMINPIVHNVNDERYRLNENQIKTIMCIHYLEKVMPSIISRALNIQRGSLTTIIKSLIEQNLIRKEIVPENNRSYFLVLTDKGKAFVDYNLNRIGQEFEALFDELSTKEVKQISDGFHLLSTYLSRKRKLLR